MLRTDTADISYPSGKLSFPAASYDKWSKDDNIYSLIHLII